MLFNTDWELSIATTTVCYNCKWTRANLVPRVVYTSRGAKKESRVKENPENEAGLEHSAYGVCAVNFKEQALVNSHL